MYQNQLYQSPLGCKFMTVILKSWLNFIGPISLASQTFTDRQLIWYCVAFSVYEQLICMATIHILFAGFPLDKH